MVAFIIQQNLLGFYLFIYLFFILLAALLQDDDAADTVGYCTLKVENVKAGDPNTLEV